MPYKLIAFDLDGTLLDDDKKISEENYSALSEAVDRGVQPVPATGRLLKAIPPELSELGIRYYILINGACVYDSLEDRILYRGEIPLDTALRCIRYMDEQNAIYDCYDNNGAFMPQSHYDKAEEYFTGSPHMLRMIRELRTPVPNLYEYLRDNSGGVQKLQMFFKPERNGERLRQLKAVEERFPELRATSSIANNVEINSVNAGKGRALTALAERLGIAAAETAAFGDGSNDTQMLKAAGCGIAMANAMDEVKAAADMVCGDNNSSGVGRTIKYLLGK